MNFSIDIHDVQRLNGHGCKESAGDSKYLRYSPNRFADGVKKYPERDGTNYNNWHSFAR